MDYTPLIAATRASHSRIRDTELDARLLIVGADPTPGLMLTAYERINPGLKLVAICTEADEAWRLLEQQRPNHFVEAFGLGHSKTLLPCLFALGTRLMAKAFSDLRMHRINQGFSHIPRFIEQ